MTAKILLIGAAFLVSACGSGNGSDEGNPGVGAGGDQNLPFQPVPSPAPVRGEKNFAKLFASAQKGQVDPMPWAGAWWPYSDEGITSAARLHDRAVGQGSAADWELRRHGSSLPGIQSWWGHCNGWAAAAVLSMEPRAPKTVGDVQFSIGAQKALLSELGMEVRGDFFGSRVNDPDDFSSAAFRDVVPNQFFLVLANFVGSGAPLIVDRYTGYQVWNHPLAAYEIAPVTPAANLGEDPSFSGTYRVEVTLKMWWLRADVPTNHVTEPFAFADGPSYASRVLRFELSLDGPLQFDSSGQLISSGDVLLPRQGERVPGGTWKNGTLAAANSHPDYIWRPHAYMPSTGYRNPQISSEFVTSQFGPSAR